MNKYTWNYIESIDDNGRNIFDVIQDNGGDYKYLFEVKNKDVARLASAAPELLEALEDLYAQACGMPKSCGHEFTCVCPDDKAKAAITKARGSKMKKQLIFGGEVHNLVLAEPEPAAEWKPRVGELCEFSDTEDFKKMRLGYFDHINMGNPYPYIERTDIGHRYCRPLQDQNIIQMIPWEGGECPVPDDTRVLIQYRDGGMWNSVAKNMRWYQAGEGNDIVKYAVLK
jgi:hypothetical protein